MIETRREIEMDREDPHYFRFGERERVAGREINGIDKERKRDIYIYM